MTDRDSVHRAWQETLQLTGGRLDVLFNNAGYGQGGAIEDLPTEALRAQFETNLFGLHELTRLVIPVMLRQRQGKIIQDSSVLGLVAMKYRGAILLVPIQLTGEGSGVRACTGVITYWDTHQGGVRGQKPSVSKERQEGTRPNHGLECLIDRATPGKWCH